MLNGAKISNIKQIQTRAGFLFSERALCFLTIVRGILDVKEFGSLESEMHRLLHPRLRSVEIESLLSEGCRGTRVGQRGRT